MNCEFLDSICYFQIQFGQIWLNSIGLQGNVLSNGLTQATPLSVMVFLGVKVDLPVFNAAETILVHLVGF